MNGKTPFIIGTRGSALALAQADMVQAALAARYPELEVRREIIRTVGDRRTDVPLADVAKVSGVVDKGIFTKELEIALLDGRIDVAVHSLKDVPSELAPEFTLAAVLPRAAVDDVLISKNPSWDGTGTLATGSVRRRKMARSRWGDQLNIVDLRGNVPTRLEKLVNNDEWDAIILARAGLERLGMFAPVMEVAGKKLYCRILPQEHFLPAVGQGIVGLECRADDAHSLEILAGINDAESLACARAERAFLINLGADCSTPVGVYAQVKDKELQLKVLYYPPQQDNPLALNICGPAHAPEQLGQKAYQQLLKF